jgi:superoxide reductase
MDRRKLIKTLGLSAAVITTGLVGACTQTGNTKEAEELKALKDSLENEKNNVLQRNKKIVNRQDMSIKDSDNPTDFELKHTPDIELGTKDEKGYTEVKITIGTGILHPSTPDHWIDYIMLYTDNSLVGNIQYEPGKALGYAVFKIKTEGVKKLTAECGCNLHGIWHSEMTLS